MEKQTLEVRKLEKIKVNFTIINTEIAGQYNSVQVVIILFSCRLGNAHSQLNNGKYSHIEVCLGDNRSPVTLSDSSRPAKFLRFVCIFRIPVYTVKLLVHHKVGLGEGQVLYFLSGREKYKTFIKRKKCQERRILGGGAASISLKL